MTLFEERGEATKEWTRHRTGAHWSANRWLVTTAFMLMAGLAQAASHPIINELAWMGTTVSTSDEWIELYNPSDASVSLAGWHLRAHDGSPNIALKGAIAPHGYYLLERTDDRSVPGLTADVVYTGALSNSGEVLDLRNAQGQLLDTVDAWYAGDNATKATMERVDPDIAGTVASNWRTATARYDVGLGTPGAPNSQADTGLETRSHLSQVSNVPGAINVYFNKTALTAYALPGNQANYDINLEQRLLARVNAARSSIDVETYEINLPEVVDALIDRAAHGVRVRIIVDAKAPTEPEYVARYETMRLYLERLARGKDGVFGTTDDCALLADSPIFAPTENPARRQALGLPPTPVGLKETTATIGSHEVTGYLLVDGERKTDGSYYAAGPQMHNKVAIIDDQWVWTGSWNFTVTGLYGSESNRLAGILGGNTQNSIEIRSAPVAAAYTTEFDEMWGGNGPKPDPTKARLHGRKADNTPHVIDVGGKTVEVYFSPGDDALGHLVSLIKDHADHAAYFDIFAWSDQPLVDALKVKWEGSSQDEEGQRTGFDVRGVFDAGFWNQWWSASIDMTGRTASRESAGNPNTRWKNPAPVFPDAEIHKLHSKTMIIDACTESDPTVVIGSTNWSANGNSVNDENMLFVHDARAANQFLQEFYARYQAAGGVVPEVSHFSCP